MSTTRPSVTKRQREQAKRDRKARKAEKRLERKTRSAETEAEEPTELEDAGLEVTPGP
ncbi:MAG TPA: hypothetical protein VNA69_20100 [Thermoanaerobaculia bacterium]|nr:hypothetical protein [Thermoanaerobaculia bacterium]